MTREQAQEILSALLSTQPGLDRAFAIAGRQRDEEWVAIRKAVARAIGAVSDVIDPIVTRFPDLNPYPSESKNKTSKKEREKGSE